MEDWNVSIILILQNRGLPRSSDALQKKAQGSLTWALTNDLDGYEVTSRHSIFRISPLKSGGEFSLLRSWAFLHP